MKQNRFIEVQNLVVNLQPEIMEMISVEPKEWVDKIEKAKTNDDDTLQKAKENELTRSNVIDLTDSFDESTSSPKITTKTNTLADQLNAIRQNRHKEWKSER